MAEIDKANLEIKKGLYLNAQDLDEIYNRNIINLRQYKAIIDIINKNNIVKEKELKEV